MASKYTHDVVATVGEYTNVIGEKKKNYQNVGKAFTNEYGQVSIKMTAMPVGPEWSGWLSMYDRKTDGEQRQPQGARSPEYGQRERSSKQNGAAPPATDDAEDDIPF